MTSDLREMLHELACDAPASPDWSGGVGQRIKVRGRRRRGLLAATVASLLAAGVTLSGAWDRNAGERLIPASPPPVSLTLTPHVAEAEVGQPVRFTADATHPDGAPVILDLLVDASGASAGQCASPRLETTPSGGTARRSFERSFTEAGVHTVEVSALPPGCQDGSLTATSMIQVSDPNVQLSNDITITAKVVQQPRAGQSDLVLDVTVTGSLEKPAVSGFFIDGDVLFLGDSCKPLGILPARGPGAFHQVYRYRYDKPGTDTITLFASSLCTPQPGQARLEVKVNILP